MICPACHGGGTYWNALLRELRPCVDCNGSGIAYCCEGLTQGVNEMATLLTRVDYDDAPEPGWYIYQYDTAEDMLAKRSKNMKGPYRTRAEATRLAADMTSQMIINTSSKRQVHDPANDATPAAFNAGIASDDIDDIDDCDDEIDAD